MSDSESALESDDEEQGLTVVPSSKAKRGARAGAGGGAAAGRSDTCNEAAILRKLEQLRGGVDTESDDAAWLETLDITASEPQHVGQDTRRPKAVGAAHTLADSALQIMWTMLKDLHTVQAKSPGG